MKKTRFINQCLRLCLLCLLCILGASPIATFAATNGSLGSTSTGTVTISLTIPAHRQIHLARVESSQQSSRDSMLQYCIGVTDRSLKPSLRNYNFTLSSLSNEPIGSLYRTSLKQQQVVELREPFSVQITNAHNRKMSAEDVCALSNGNFLHFDKIKNHSAPLLLELIPE